MTSHRTAETMLSSSDMGSRTYKAALVYFESQYIVQTVAVRKNLIDDLLK